MDEYCGKCWGIVIIVIGVVIVANAWLSFINPWLLIGVLLITGGVLRMRWPTCGCGGYCHAPPMDAPVVKRR
jgi:hypothetical protein